LNSQIIAKTGVSAKQHDGLGEAQRRDRALVAAKISTGWAAPRLLPESRQLRHCSGPVEWKLGYYISLSSL